MTPVMCEVHQILKGDPQRVAQIRANAFQNKKGRFIVQITSTHGISACFEAEYADDDYMKRWQAKGINFSHHDLIFISELCRTSLEIKPQNRIGVVDVAEIQKQEVKLQSVYAVHSALSEDSNEGRVYIRDEKLRSQLEGKRYIACIKRKDAKPVYVEALYADPNYLGGWKEKGINFVNSGPDYNFIFISAWYRRLLSIGSTPVIVDDLDIELQSPRNLWTYLRALLYRYPRDHPQALVRIANMMGIISFGLGAIGLGLGIFSIQTLFPGSIPGIVIVYILSFVFGLLGLASAIIGFRGLIRR